MKRCPDCDLIKPLEDFPVAKRRRDGRGTYCRLCMRERSKRSYRKRMAEQGRRVRDRLVVPPGTRACSRCGEIKMLDAFPSNPSGRNGRGTYCNPCHDLITRTNRISNYGSTAEYHRKYRYGLKRGEYARMLDQQAGLCAVCRERPADHVDHCHEKGHVRGILCFNCNGGLGQFRDRVDILKKAIDYLERTRDARWLSSE